MSIGLPCRWADIKASTLPQNCSDLEGQRRVEAYGGPNGGRTVRCDRDRVSHSHDSRRDQLRIRQRSDDAVKVAEEAFVSEFGRLVSVVERAVIEEWSTSRIVKAVRGVITGSTSFTATPPTSSTALMVLEGF